jgi:23S rRNA (adenine-N6)-dimethyltransferase
VTVVEADAERWIWPTRPFAVVANLPFARSGAILDHLLGDPSRPLRRVDAIVQWELAAKHTAVWPSTLRGVYWRAWFDVSISRRLSRVAFAPPPRVDAAVLRLIRRPRPLVQPSAAMRYRGFLGDAFRSGQPIRRAVGGGLTPLEVKRLAPALGCSADARPWDLDYTQWAGLFESAERRRR